MIEIFLSDYLHDSEITSINFLKVTNKKRNVYNLTLYLKNEEFEGGIVHYDVIKYTNSFSNSLDFGYPCEYLYGEVLYEDELWSHNIRYTENNELSIHCKSIDWIANS